MNNFEAVYFFKLYKDEHTLDEVFPEELRADPEVVLAAVQWGKGLSENLAHASKEVLDNRDFALQLADVDRSSALKYLSERLRDDRDVVLAFVAAWKAGTNLEFASERLKADDEVIRTALKSNGMALAFVPEKRRGDSELLSIAYRENSKAIVHIPPALLEDREFILDMVTQQLPKEGLLQYLPEQYANDREVVMQILTKDAASLKFVSELLRNDQQVVLHAMFSPSINDLPAMGFEFASPTIRKDKAIVATALERLKAYRPDYRRQASTSIKDVHKLALAADKGAVAAEVTDLKAVLRDIRKSLQGKPVGSWETAQQSERLESIRHRLIACNNNPTLMTAWVEADYLRHPLYCNSVGESVENISDTLMKDHKFLVGLMRASNGAVLAKFDPAIQGDSAFVLSTIGHGTPKESIAPALRRDPAFLAGLIGRLEFISQIREIPDPSMWQDRTFVMMMVALRGSLLDSASAELKADPEVVRTAFSQDRSSLGYADPSFFTDREFMGNALKSGAPAAADHLAEPLLSDIDFLIECLSGASKGESSTMARTLLKRVPRKVRSDKGFLSICLKCNGWGIESVPESLQYDADVLAAAFSSGASVWKILDRDRLRTKFSRVELEKMVQSQENLDAIFAK